MASEAPYHTHSREVDLKVVSLVVLQNLSLDQAVFLGH